VAFQNILVPIDFSQTSLRALELAVSVARTSGAQLTLLFVTTTQMDVMTASFTYSISPALLELKERIENEARENLEQLRRALVPDAIESTAKVRPGLPPETILEQVRVGSHDLVVMGTHGHTGIERVLIGSVTERVLRRSPVPVLVTH
jgi:nucleotide-binding universal stress UspA family protein